MAPAISTKLTYEDYCLIPDDGRRHEIIDGEHYVNPSPNTKHQMVVRNISFAMWQYVRPRRLGQVFAAPYDVVLSTFNIVEPDVIFVGKAREHIITEANITGAPDLVVEVLSTNYKYDEVVKFKAYQAMDIPEYWIADPVRETVKIYRRAAGRFALAETGDAVTTPLLPGFTLPLREIFDFAP
jgi:Uma2 family endonuclease